MSDRAESILKDITHREEKPLWPLTSYGPSKSLLTLIADLDESPEELRVKAAQALRSNSVDQYVSSLTAPKSRPLTFFSISDEV
jgi:nucleoporin NUP42